MTWVVVWFPICHICPFPINQSVVFYVYWYLTRRPDPLWPIFPDRLASKSWCLSGVFFSPSFLDQKEHAGYLPSVQKHLPKIFSTQSNPRKDPEWALRPSFPKLGRWSSEVFAAFLVEFDRKGWMETHGKLSFSHIFLERRSIYQLLHQATRILTQQSQDMRRTWRWWWIHWGISPASRRCRGKMVLFSSPSSTPRRFIQTGRPQATDVFRHRTSLFP